MLGAQGLWAGRDLYRATSAVTLGLGFSGLIRRTAPLSRLLRHARGWRVGLTTSGSGGLRRPSSTGVLYESNGRKPHFVGFLASDLSITEETWVVEMHISCIKIGNVLLLHFNPWVEASAGGLLVPEGLYSPVAKYLL
jgi:hypothetical protein